jgi:hypothetical protein
MPHPLADDFTSTVYSERTGEPLPDSAFHFDVDEATEQLRLPQSTHQGRALTSGRVRGNNHIELIDHRGNEYVGILIVNIPLPNNTSLKVICGRRRLNVLRTDRGEATTAEGEGAEGKRPALLDQENAIWVATKP